MKKGYVHNQFPDSIEANHDLVYFVALNGKERDPLFLQKWNNANTFKRGLIHRPALGVDINEYDNASAFKWLVDELGYSNWNNGVPLIIDIWGAPTETRFNFDHIRVYGSYITEHFKPLVKPLLRINIATWNSFVSSNRTEALRLLNNYELLLVQPGALLPTSLTDYGIPAWWEYQLGKVAYDSSKLWLDSPNKPVTPTPEPEPQPEPEPIPEPEPEPEPYIIKYPRKFIIKLFGGLIKGTIEAVDE